MTFRVWRRDTVRLRARALRLAREVIVDLVAYVRNRLVGSNRVCCLLAYRQAKGGLICNLRS